MLNIFVRATLLTLLALLGGPLLPAQAARAVSPVPAPAFSNPVIAADMPDPDLLRVGRTYYAYSTNVALVNTPVFRSADLVHWKAAGEAFPELPNWALGGYTWAPSLLNVAGGYRLYFTARHAPSGKQCIGVAASGAPTGPFVSRATTPLVCQLSLGGSIDAQAIRAGDGKLYLYWKNDGNCCDLPTRIWAQQLSGDGLRLVGQAVPVLSRDQPWEGGLIEGPSVYRHGGSYYLFYSAGGWDTPGYAVGYAVASTPTGPFRKVLTRPLLASAGKVAGPGGQGVIEDAQGRTWMYYHAWAGGKIGYAQDGVRSLRLDPLLWTGGRPEVKATTRVQPAPRRP